jgi:DNA modification methylase
MSLAGNEMAGLHWRGEAPFVGSIPTISRNNNLGGEMTERFNLFEGNCLEVMATMAENSIDSIVTDPPYELGFMGKSWDSSGIAFNIEVWQEALRVLKPGGHLLAFSGSRTYHRMAVAIEDAGFEIRDQIMWVYGSGFPKSHNVSKGIDKNNGEVGRLLKFTNWMRTTGLKSKQLDEATGTNMGGHYLTTASQPAIPTVALWAKIRPLIADVPVWVDELVDRIEAEREVIGTKFSGIANKEEGQRHTIGASKAVEVEITIPSTDAAKQWDGWGTALKPAHEPIVLARKPLIGTVANNVLTFGTGGLNIDGSRVGSEGGTFKASKPEGKSNGIYGEGINGTVDIGQLSAGRWPANVIHDGSEEVVELFPDSKGGAYPAKRGQAINTAFASGQETEGGFRAMGDSGSAARFFYCAKASKKDRNEGLDGFENKTARSGMGGTMPIDDSGNDRDRFEVTQKNHHPTVKPTTLMQYLVRLVTPPNGIVLDPFLGSGSTGKAAMYEGFNFIGIELTPEYLPIAKARIEFALASKELELDFDTP